MEIKIEERKVLSSDHLHWLIGKVYIPDGEIKAYFHVVHGMTEHIGRYDSFMTEMAKAGYLVFGYDHLGHGKTAKDDSELGFFAEKNGYERVAEDVKVFSDAIRNEFGNHPYYLMGHSMGSFIVRLASWKYLTPDKLIVMGTGGPNPIFGVALGLIRAIIKIYGPKHISPFIEGLAFGSYNKHFQSENDSLSWLTKNKEIREIYRKDKFCTFHFTASALYDLVKMNQLVNTKDCFAKTKNDLPILFVSGSEDPVGDYGEGVKKAFSGYRKYNPKAELKLYENCRHEILNDTCRDEVIADILKFSEAKI